jgi:hypothetical protein
MAPAAVLLLYHYLGVAEKRLATGEEADMRTKLNSIHERPEQNHAATKSWCCPAAASALLHCRLCIAEKRVAKGEEAQEAEMRTKLNSMRNDRLAAVAQQQAHERSMPVRTSPALLLLLHMRAMLRVRDTTAWPSPICRLCIGAVVQLKAISAPVRA